MDFIDEEHFPGLQVREHRGEVAGLLDHRPRRGPDRHFQLVGYHGRERRLAKPRWTVQEHVVERLAALLRGGD